MKDAFEFSEDYKDLQSLYQDEYSDKDKADYYLMAETIIMWDACPWVR